MYEDAYQWQLMENVFDGLVRFDPDLNVTPGLARSWTVSPDGLTFSFDLKPNARFHNGRPVTPADVVYSYVRAARSTTGIAKEYFAHVAGAQAVIEGKSTTISGLQIEGPHQLTIRLSHSYAPFLATLATPPFRVVPREEVESRGSAFSRQPIGSGPFRVRQWRPDNVLELEPFEDYPGGRPYLDSVEVHFGNWEDEVEPFLRGELDR